MAPAAGSLWLAYALSAAVLWGLSYTLTEQVMRKLSIASVFLASALGGTLFALTFGLATGHLKRDWETIRTAGAETKLLLVCVFVYVTANALILLSIKSKNATMAGMIEISYPLFTALFAWAFFREAQMSIGTLLGFTLIILGVACIYFLDKTV